MGTFANIWHGVRREPENPRVGGSIPSQATKPKTSGAETFFANRPESPIGTLLTPPRRDVARPASAVAAHGD
jgi:hypothetical protein